MDPVPSRGRCHLRPIGSASSCGIMLRGSPGLPAKSSASTSTGTLIGTPAGSQGPGHPAESPGEKFSPRGFALGLPGRCHVGVVAETAPGGEGAGKVQRPGKGQTAGFDCLAEVQPPNSGCPSRQKFAGGEQSSGLGRADQGDRRSVGNLAMGSN